MHAGILGNVGLCPYSLYCHITLFYNTPEKQEASLAGGLDLPQVTISYNPSLGGTRLCYSAVQCETVLTVRGSLSGLVWAEALPQSFDLCVPCPVTLPVKLGSDRAPVRGLSGDLEEVRPAVQPWHSGPHRDAEGVRRRQRQFEQPSYFVDTFGVARLVPPSVFLLLSTVRHCGVPEHEEKYLSPHWGPNMVTMRLALGDSGSLPVSPGHWLAFYPSPRLVRLLGDGSQKLELFGPPTPCSWADADPDFHLAGAPTWPWEAGIRPGEWWVAAVGSSAQAPALLLTRAGRVSACTALW